MKQLYNLKVKSLDELVEAGVEFYDNFYKTDLPTKRDSIGYLPQKKVTVAEVAESEDDESMNGVKLYALYDNNLLRMYTENPKNGIVVEFQRYRADPKRAHLYKDMPLPTVYPEGLKPYIVKAENKIGNTVYAEFEVMAKDEWDAVEIGKRLAKRHGKDPETGVYFDKRAECNSYTDIVAYREDGHRLAELSVW